MKDAEPKSQQGSWTGSKSRPVNSHDVGHKNGQGMKQLFVFLEILLFLGVIVAFDYNLLVGCISLCVYLIFVIYMFMVFRRKPI